MPKETFHKLKEDKKQLIKQAFYKEFALKSFDDASITQVVKQLGIAKGSIYQYFENKLELYLYLMQEAGELKAQFLAPILRESYYTFWDYMREVYLAEIRFDTLHFLESHFLHVAFNNIKSPSIQHVFEQWNTAILKEFTDKVQFEINIGLFHNYLPADKMAFVLHQNLKSIHESMTHFYGLDTEKNLLASQGVYSEEMAIHLLQTVDEHFFLLKRTFNLINQ